MTLKNYLFAALGLTLTLANVNELKAGVPFKTPEMILIGLTILWIVRPKLPAHGEPSKIVLAAIFALILIPLFSIFFGYLVNFSEIRIGANKLGILTALGAQDPYEAPWIMLFRNFLTLGILLSCFQMDRKDHFLFFRFSLVSLFLLNVYSLYDGFCVNLLNLPDFPWLGDHRTDFYHGFLRARGFLAEPLLLGHILIYLTPLTFTSVQYFESKRAEFLFKKVNRYLCFLSFSITFSTGAMVSILLGYGAIFLISKKFSFKTFLKMIGTATVALLLALLHPSTRYAFIDKLVLSLVDPTKAGYTALDRIYKAQSAFNIFLDHPFIGAGLGATGFLYPLYSSFLAYVYYDMAPNPLNEYSRILGDLGILGLLSLFIFALLYLRFLFRNEDRLSRAEVLMYAGGFLSTLVILNFWALLNWYYIWVMIGVSIVQISRLSPVSE